MYEELVKRLRNAAQWADKGLVITPSVCLEAADAIEDMNRSIDSLEADNESLCQKIEELRNRIDRAIDLYNRNIEKTAMYEALAGISQEPPKEET